MTQYSAAPPLAHVVVLTPTRNGVGDKTRLCIDALERAGAARMSLGGCSDVALARNSLMTEALRRAESDKTVFLLVDDDMLFTAPQAELMCDRALNSEHPVSAVYSTAQQTLAHTPFQGRLWLCGLGFCALKRTQLQAYAEKIGKVRVGGTQVEIHPFCESGVSGQRWLSEDYWFSERIGGIEVISIGVGHLKPVPIIPSAETLDMVSNYDAATAQKKKEEAADAAE